MSGSFVLTEDIKVAVLDHEGVVLDAVGISGWRTGRHVRCPYPSHADKRPSWRWDVAERRAFCTCDDRAADIFEVVARMTAVGFPAAKLRVAEMIGRSDLIHEKNDGCSLAAFADAKRLPVDWLTSLGVREIIGKFGKPVVEIPYYNVDRALLTTRTRIKLTGKNHTLSAKGSKASLYGVDRLDEARSAGYVCLVEGETDCWTLWLNGIPAVGLPGGGVFNDERDAPYLADIPEIYAVIEPDHVGERLAEKLGRSSLADRVRLIQLRVKDPSALWLDVGVDRERFRAEFETALDNAEPCPTPPPLPEEGDELIRETIEPHAITDIPPRPWAYGAFLLFGHAAVIGAVDGGGKGAHAVAISLSMITGQALLEEHVWRTGPVAIITYEDDKNEWDRRIAAACTHYKLDYASVKNQFHFLIRKDRSRVRFAAQSGAGTIYPDGDGVIRHLKEIGAVLSIVDPFNLAHDTEDGNSNVVIAKVAGEVSRIAAASGAAVLVLHHLRKGAIGNVDDLMGAVALRANFRSCRILTRMSQKDVEDLGLPVRQHWRYSRIADSKENYATPPEFATWYRLESVELGNPAGIYVNGDNVQVTTTWTPPSPFAGIPLSTIAQIFEELRAGAGKGEFYSPDRRAKRWAGSVIVKKAGKSEEEAARVLRTWLAKDKSVLIKDEYHSPERGEDVNRVILNEIKVAEILGPLYNKTEIDK
jgi:hypothetical protein